MEKGLEIARGKTKVLSELSGQPEVAVISQFDRISAGNGARTDELAGKGRLAALTSSRVFRLLNLCGLPTHYLRGGEDDDGNEMLVRRCTMIPVEVVVRGVAAGSLVKRRPGIQRGSLLVPRLVEFFLKDDAANDPQVEPDELIARGLMTIDEVNTAAEIARLTFDILAHAWRRRDVMLVDLKLEFGHLATGEGKGNLVIADVIDNDSWRIWPGGREDLQLDKQVYRSLTDVTPAALRTVLANYEQVAELAGSFPVMRGAMVAAMCDVEAPAETVDRFARALSNYGIPITRHLTSLTRIPAQLLSMVQQIEVSFSRLHYVGIGDEQLAQMINFATPMPTSYLAADANQARCELLALRISKAFALDDTVLYGRTLLMQGNQRVAVLNADAIANAPERQAAVSVPSA